MHFDLLQYIFSYTSLFKSVYSRLRIWVVWISVQLEMKCLLIVSGSMSVENVEIIVIQFMAILLRTENSNGVAGRKNVSVFFNLFLCCYIKKPLFLSRFVVPTSRGKADK